MKVFAFGEMGISPNEFYQMDLEDYYLKVEGFTDARIWFERSLRRLAQIVQAPHVDSRAPSMLKQWPIMKDEQTVEQIKVNQKNNSVKTLASFIRRAQGENNK